MACVHPESNRMSMLEGGLSKQGKSEAGLLTLIIPMIASREIEVEDKITITMLVLYLF